VIHSGKRKRICHGGADRASEGLHGVGSAELGAADAGCRPGAPVSGPNGDPGRRSRGDAAQVGDVGRQTIRDWVLQFNAEGPGLSTGKPPGQAPRFEAEHQAALVRWVEDDPMPAVDGVVRWRLATLRSGCSRSSGS